MTHIGQPLKGNLDNENGLDAQFMFPDSLALSPDGDRLFCCDLGNRTLRCIDLQSKVSALRATQVTLR